MKMKKDDDEKIRRRYFLWLCDLVGVGEPGHNCKEFAWVLFHKEFTWFVPNDDNRLEDGKKLREEFIDKTLIDGWECLDGPCSIFEMLIALSRRIEFMLRDPAIPDRTDQWFWMMIHNLGLNIFNDTTFNIDEKIYNNDLILNKFLERTYMDNGLGGLFPLNRPHANQRRVEIWYQLMAYLDENESDLIEEIR